MRRLSQALIVAVLAALVAAGSAQAARKFTSYVFRISNVTLRATTVIDLNGDDGFTRTTEQLMRTATASYRGRRGDDALYVDQPRVPLAGQLNMSHLLPMTVHETGSWKRANAYGTSESGVCGGSRKFANTELETLFVRSRGSINLEIGLPGIEADFEPQCAVEPELDSVGDKVKLTLRASTLRARKVNIPLTLKKSDGAETLTWNGGITLKRLAICHTLACESKHP